jgi:hypothetical protein
MTDQPTAPEKDECTYDAWLVLGPLGKYARFKEGTHTQASRCIWDEMQYATPFAEGWAKRAATANKGTAVKVRYTVKEL